MEKVVDTDDSNGSTRSEREAEERMRPADGTPERLLVGERSMSQGERPVQRSRPARRRRRLPLDQADGLARRDRKQPTRVASDRGSVEVGVWGWGRSEDVDVGGVRLESPHTGRSERRRRGEGRVWRGGGRRGGERRIS